MATNFRPFNWTHKTSIVYKSFPIRSPKALKKLFDYSGYSISYRCSNPGFLIFLAFDCFSFAVYLEVVFLSHQIPAILPQCDNLKSLRILKRSSHQVQFVNALQTCIPTPNQKF